MATTNCPPISKNKEIYWSAAATGAASALIIVGIIYATTLFWPDNHLLETANCLYEGKLSFCYFDKDWNSSNYLSALTSFYNTIIVILIGLITLIGALAFLSIKHSAKSYAEAQLPILTKEHFQSTQGRNELAQIIEQQLKSIRQELTETRELINSEIESNSKINRSVSLLNDKIIDIENILENHDSGEIIIDNNNVNYAMEEDA